jgi:hypothetical protein
MFDLNTVRDAAKAVLNRAGRDFRYSTNSLSACWYKPITDDNDPLLHGEVLSESDPRRTTGCFIGEILTRLGETRHLNSEDAIAPLARFHGDMLSDDAIRYLQTMQYRQDAAVTWGAAYDFAEKSLR